MKDFGRSEFWDIEPDKIIECKIKGHILTNEPIKNKYAMHRLTCKDCDYTFTYLCHSD